MAYTNPAIDLTSPADTDLASHGDDEIRAIKRDLKERLETFFEDIDADPLVMKTSVNGTTLKSGLIAARPNPPDSTFYWATDENILYIDEGGAWEEVAPAEPPGSPAVIDDVVFGQLKGLHLTGTITNKAVPDTTETLYALNFGGSTALSYDGYILLGVRYRTRLNGGSWPTKWSYVGEGKDANISGTQVTGQSIYTSLRFAELVHGDNPPFGVEDYIRVAFASWNSTGAPVNIDVEIAAFVLAIS